MWITYKINVVLSTIYTLTNIFTGKNVTSLGKAEMTMMTESVQRNVNLRQMVSVYSFSSRDIAAANSISQDQFPDDFIFGVSSSDSQVAGTLDVDGKSIWDVFTHSEPNKIIDGSKNIIDDDFYYKYKEDIVLVKELGANAYKISLSWSRILPTGLTNETNYKGVKYYNDVINEMISKRITPVVALLHRDDLPNELNLIGGWTNPETVTWFLDYAKLAFRFFGDRVKHWVTMNEPRKICRARNVGEDAPGVNSSGIVDYKCGHQILLAHATVFRLYDEKFRTLQNGQVGITLNLDWYEPANYDSESDMEAARRRFVFENEWFLHPLVKGDYPEIMKQLIKVKSDRERFENSRLPSFSTKEIIFIKDTLDFLDINYYSSHKVTVIDKNNDTLDKVSFENDVDAVLIEEEKDAENDSQGLELMLEILNEKYTLPKLYITGNGYWDEGGVFFRDAIRSKYQHGHISRLLKVMKTGVDIRGYFTWSLFDNFEWRQSYTESAKPRTTKMKKIDSSRRMPP